MFNTKLSLNFERERERVEASPYKNNYSKKILTSLAFSSLLFFNGCGGASGSSSDNDGGGGSLATNTGTFVDSPVQGLRYETSSLSGYTNSVGQFQYKTGETVTFKIGNLELGSAKGGLIMTPLTLTGESDLNNISSKAANIARILQSLDENSSNNGLIKLPSSLKDLI
jgi:para-nitrobenzyl esterase